jgi:hypothetical protein
MNLATSFEDHADSTILAPPLPHEFHHTLLLPLRHWLICLHLKALILHARLCCYQDEPWTAYLLAFDVSLLPSTEPFGSGCWLRQSQFQEYVSPYQWTRFATRSRSCCPGRSSAITRAIVVGKLGFLPLLLAVDGDLWQLFPVMLY